MIIDSTHKPWLVATLAGVAVVSAGYFISLWAFVAKPGGGTPFGLACGFAGTAVILFEGLLSVRKKYPTVRVGRTHHWLKAHVWLGLLAFVVILFHSGFSLGGSLTSALMFLFALITLSGIAGVVLQQIVPRMMMSQLQEEAIFEQMDVTVKALRESADNLVNGLMTQSTKAAVAGTHVSVVVQSPYVGLEEIYKKEIRPFLHDEKRHEMLTSRQKARILFDHIRKLLPPPAHEPLAQLEKLVERRRELALQAKLHYVLYGWLMVHVPLSAALLILVFVHAWMALRLT